MAANQQSRPQFCHQPEILLWHMSDHYVRSPLEGTDQTPKRNSIPGLFETQSQERRPSYRMKFPRNLLTSGDLVDALGIVVSLKIIIVITFGY
jgi:hypothetical protein